MKKVKENINQTINGKCEGYWEHYCDNGQLRSKGHYKNGLYEGYWEFYYPSGHIAERGDFKGDQWIGYWENYYPNGQSDFKEFNFDL